MAREQLFYRYRDGSGRPELQPGRPRWTVAGELVEPLLWWRVELWHNHAGQPPEPAWVAESAVLDEDGRGWPQEYWILGSGRRLGLVHGFQDDHAKPAVIKSLDEAVQLAEAIERRERAGRGTGDVR